MLKHSRWQTAAILGVTAFFCLAAVPNVLPARALAALPGWATRTVPLGFDLQGGSYLQFEVDAQDVRKQLIESLHNDVRRILREARIGHAGLTTRGDTLEVRMRDASDLLRAREHLGQLVGPVPGGSARMVVEGQLIRLTLTHTYVSERITQGRDVMVERLSRFLHDVGTGSASIRPVGSDRVVLELPGITDATRLSWHY